MFLESIGVPSGGCRKRNGRCGHFPKRSLGRLSAQESVIFYSRHSRIGVRLLLTMPQGCRRLGSSAASDSRRRDLRCALVGHQLLGEEMEEQVHADVRQCRVIARPFITKKRMSGVKLVPFEFHPRFV